MKMAVDQAIDHKHTWELKKIELSQNCREVALGLSH